MKIKCGTIMMILGAVLLMGALSLFLYNDREETMAGEAAEEVLSHMVEEIELRMETQETTLPTAVDIPQELLSVEDVTMTEVEINGYNYIGYLSMPSIRLEVPVMSDWDYNRLKIAPCRYYGSSKSDDLVIMAHSYRKHFGSFSTSLEGDAVYFTDMDGITTAFEVVAVEFLTPRAVEEMTAGEYDLKLFTCTYGARSRVTLCCDRVEDI